MHRHLAPGMPSLREPVHAAQGLACVLLVILLAACGGGGVTLRQRKPQLRRLRQLPRPPRCQRLRLGVIWTRPYLIQVPLVMQSRAFSRETR